MKQLTRYDISNLWLHESLSFENHENSFVLPDFYSIAYMFNISCKCKNDMNKKYFGVMVCKN